MTTAKYINKEENIVKIGNTLIPKGHRLWAELVEPILDQIEPYKEQKQCYLSLRKEAYKKEIDNGFFFECLYAGGWDSWKARVDEINDMYKEE